jgi:hypothetical protein
MNKKPPAPAPTDSRGAAHRSDCRAPARAGIKPPSLDLLFYLPSA